jgi:transposase
MRRVELFELIRKDHEFGLSKREISRKRGIHRRTVRQALASAVPPQRKRPVRPCPKLTPEIKVFIDQILISDRAAPRKQRHTARRIWQRVRAEQGSDVAEPTVRAYVRKRRRELGVGVQVFVPQHHSCGAQAEADFYQAKIDFPWGRETAHIIAVRSEFSGASLHTAYPQQTQAALLEGIEKGFHFHGGAFPVVRLDNLPEAVKKILKGGSRREQDRFIAFRSHYLFESSFTSPGAQGAHEKGGIEGEVGRFRRRWLTPVPQMSSWAELNDYLARCCISDMDRTIARDERTVAAKRAIEHEFLRPLPAERFELAEISSPIVDSKARIQVRTNRYSVPVSLVGRAVSVRLTPLEVIVTSAGDEVATHDRLQLRNAEHLSLDHYLEVLLDRPGAFPGSLPLHQARMRGEFSPAHELLWARLKVRLGDKAGTRALIEVLLLYRNHSKEVMGDAITEALEVGAIDPQAIALLARHRSNRPEEPSQLALDVGDLARFDRPEPDTAAYEALIGRAS